MGLSETKRKTRLIGSATTKNSAWTNDASLPGQRLLSSMGWSQGQGLGSSSQGSATPITMAFKMDNKGIGARRHEREARANGKADAWIGGGGDLGNLFERLNQASAAAAASASAAREESSSSSDDTSDKKTSKKSKRSNEEKARDKAEKKRSKKDKGEKKEKKEKKKSHRSSKGKEKAQEADEAKVVEAVEEVAAAMPHRLASRARFLRAKRMVGTDQASVNEILGISASSPAGSSSPAIKEALSVVSSPAAPGTPIDVTAEADSTGKEENKTKKSKRKRDDNEESEKGKEKEEKRARKEAKRAAKEEKKHRSKGGGQGEADAAPAPIVVQSPSADPSFAAGGGMKVSALSVQDYLQGQLMKRRAAVLRKRRGEESSLWSRAAAVQVP